MLTHKIQGFSLIEVMVVIAIVAAAAVFALQSYKSYSVESNFVQVLTTIEQYKNDAQAAFIDNDQFPTQISGQTVATYNAISSPGLNYLYYGRSTDMKSAYLQFFTIDLGVPGYNIAGSGGSGCVKCRVTTAIIHNADGHMQFYCGQWDGSTADVPLTYLPKSCQDTNITALIT